MAMEAVLGLLGVSLVLVLLPVQTFFKKEVALVFVGGVWTSLSGLGLLCGGRNPSLCCVKFNMILHLFTFILSAVSFGSTVRHVPFQQRRYCSSDCDWVSHEATVLVSGILSVLVTVLLVETLVSLVVIGTFLCFLSRDDPEQPEDPERIGPPPGSR